MADELISREALIRDIHDCVVFSGRSDRPSAEIRGARKILDRINAAPTVDAVEVVRCKDCEYFLKAEVNGNGFLICQVTDKEIFEDDYGISTPHIVSHVRFISARCVAEN